MKKVENKTVADRPLGVLQDIFHRPDGMRLI